MNLKLISLVFLFISFTAFAEPKTQFYCDNGPDLAHPTLLTITKGNSFAAGKVEYSNVRPGGEFIWLEREPEVGTEQVKADLMTISRLASIPGAEYLKGLSKKFHVLEATAQGPSYMIMRQKIYIDSAVITGARDAGVVIFTNQKEAGSAISRTAEVTYCQLVAVPGR